MVEIQQSCTKMVWMGPCSHTEELRFAQHREQKAENISVLPSAPLGENVTGRTEPDSSWRCKAKEQDRKVTNCGQENTKHFTW